eukprot:5533178-Amphidinium_carterae.1
MSFKKKLFEASRILWCIVLTTTCWDLAQARSCQRADAGLKLLAAKPAAAIARWLLFTFHFSNNRYRTECRMSSGIVHKGSA